MMRAAWVVGSGGLLGRALVRELRDTGTAVFRQQAPLPWLDEGRLLGQMAVLADAFTHWAAAAREVEIYWAAGVGGMGSTELAMSAETRCLERFVDLIAKHPGLPAQRTAFALASSAGGIYAGSSAAIIDESTPPMPTTPYARGKLQQEEIVRRSLGAAGSAVLVARFSTLYGPGQAADKRQGLITHVARSVLQNRPVRIYVPFDTIRDYMYSADAARTMIASLRSSLPGAEPVVRIVASERPTTVADILDTGRRISRKRLLFTSAIDPMGHLYSQRARYRSCVFPEHSRLATTTLTQGLARVLAAERERFARPGGEALATPGRT
jgi:UDP-glucose 4-epimerase